MNLSLQSIYFLEPGISTKDRSTRIANLSFCAAAGTILGLVAKKGLSTFSSHLFSMPAVIVLPATLGIAIFAVFSTRIFLKQDLPTLLTQFDKLSRLNQQFALLDDQRAKLEALLSIEGDDDFSIEELKQVNAEIELLDQEIQTLNDEIIDFERIHPNLRGEVKSRLEKKRTTIDEPSLRTEIDTYLKEIEHC